MTMTPGASRRRPAGLTVRGRSDHEPGILEHVRQYFTDVAVVVDHEHRIGHRTQVDVLAVQLLQ